jgi:hypothetical protein
MTYDAVTLAFHEFWPDNNNAVFGSKGKKDPAAAPVAAHLSPRRAWLIDELWSFAAPSLIYLLDCEIAVHGRAKRNRTECELQ